MSEILKYNLFTEKFQYKDISNNDLDTFKDDELNRILICTNDGQGDTNCYTYKEIYEIISESDIRLDGTYIKGKDFVKNHKVSEIIDEFCQDLSGNMTEYIYFDVSENRYKKINWV